MCVNYKDLEYLREETEDAKRLGFTGKVCIKNYRSQHKRDEINANKKNSKQSILIKYPSSIAHFCLLSGVRMVQCTVCSF